MGHRLTNTTSITSTQSHSHRQTRLNQAMQCSNEARSSLVLKEFCFKEEIEEEAANGADYLMEVISKEIAA